LNPSRLVYTALQNHLNQLNALLNSHYTDGLVRNAQQSSLRDTAITLSYEQKLKSGFLCSSPPPVRDCVCPGDVSPPLKKGTINATESHPEFSNTLEGWQGSAPQSTALPREWSLSRRSQTTSFKMGEILQKSKETNLCEPTPRGRKPHKNARMLGEREG